MAKPPGSLSSEMVAVVSSLVAVKPALPSCAESAIVKQPACAAASSSSGLVPTPFSNRVLKEYCVCLSTPLSVEMVPLPSFKPPCHTADALRCITSLLLRFSQYSSQENSIPGLVGRVYSENAAIETRLRAVMTSVLEQTAHRPWPLPVGPWVMAQRWHDLLFAHWPVPAAELQHLIPTPLTIDTFNGQAWLAVVPFRMSRVRLRGTPAVLSRADALFESRRLDRVRQSAGPHQSSRCGAEGALPSCWPGYFSWTRYARIFHDGTLLPLHARRQAQAHLRRDSSSALAAANGRSPVCAKYDGGSGWGSAPGGQAAAAFREKARRHRVAARAFLDRAKAHPAIVP